MEGVNSILDLGALSEVAKPQTSSRWRSQFHPLCFRFFLSTRNIPLKCTASPWEVRGVIGFWYKGDGLCRLLMRVGVFARGARASAIYNNARIATANAFFVKCAQMRSIDKVDHVSRDCVLSGSNTATGNCSFIRISRP